MKIQDSFASGFHQPVVGARVDRKGVSYRVWSPAEKELCVVVQGEAGRRQITLQPESNGYWVATDHAGRVGDTYQFRFSDGRLRPDPASRFQPQGVHGPSACIDPSSFSWRAQSWVRPAWKGQSIYEIHVGTFTEQGTYLAAIEKLDHLRDLGIEAIELMPVADFAGERNWGYDGVALYAPAHCHGHPDTLRAFVDAAHARGLAVILDVVYNHLGPAGNYLADFSPHYFRTDQHTPWGQGFNLDLEFSRPVRDFVVGNAAHWLDEFRFDGLRLDATHAISDRSDSHLLTEIASVVQVRGGFLIAEDERNEARLILPRAQGGLGLDALWADDFHHQVRVALTHTRDSYFKAYRGTAADLADTLAHGWTYRGQNYEPWKNRPRGSASEHLPPTSFVFCIENHDQVGNRAKGERLEHLVTPQQFRAASMLLCLSPHPPLLFMGQEWAASTPFLYFTDHGGELGGQISVGRKKEFEQHGSHWQEGNFPDPEAPGTFNRSKLRWTELGEPDHAACLALYKKCLEQRRCVLQGECLQRGNWQVASFGEFIAIRYDRKIDEYLLVVSLGNALFPTGTLPAILQPAAGMKWRKNFGSREIFENKMEKPSEAFTWKFNGPGAVWLESTREEISDATR